MNVRTACSWLVRGLAIGAALAGVSGQRLEAAPLQQPIGRAENVRFEVAEGGVVRIFYDLIADPGQVVGIRLLVSQDGGQMFALTAASVSGDVGPAVVPGTGKRITWESARDVERLDADRLRIRLEVAALAVIQQPRRFWGVSVSAVPHWSVPANIGDDVFNGQRSDVGAAELRVAIVRGASQGGDWGISLVRKRLEPGSAVARRGPLSPIMTTTYTVTSDSGWLTGVEVHTFRPFVNIGSRVQVGVLLAAGLANYLNGTVERRTESPIYATNPLFSSTPPQVVPVGPGFALDRSGVIVAVPAGETGVVDKVEAKELYGGAGWNVLRARAELAASFALRNRMALRVSGGFNFPGVQLFSVEFAHFFGP
jgi:hypothetical protein